MGMTAALKFEQVVRLARTVLAIELISAARGLDLRKPLKTSPVLEAVRAKLAEIVAPWIGDRPFSEDIERAAQWLAKERLS